MDRATASGTRLATMGAYFLSVANDANYAKVEALEKLAKAHGHTLLELAMSWLASQPTVGSVIAGVTTPEQVRTNAKEVCWKLTAAERAEIDGALASAG